MAIDAVHVLGNHDRYLIDRPPEKMGSWDRPAHAQLDQVHLDWLRAVPPTESIATLCFSATPRRRATKSIWLETVDPDGSVHMTPLDRIEKLAEGITQPLILCGHTHVARVVRLRDGRLIVNPGSVGSPGYRDTHPFPHVIEAGTPDARYAILELADGIGCDLPPCALRPRGDGGAGAAERPAGAGLGAGDGVDHLEAQHQDSSYAGLTRASINLQRSLFEGDG
jgi:Predicted phosphoesterases, related to the Icc protein